MNPPDFAARLLPFANVEPPLQPLPEPFSAETGVWRFMAAVDAAHVAAANWPADGIAIRAAAFPPILATWTERMRAESLVPPDAAALGFTAHGHVRAGEVVTAADAIFFTTEGPVSFARPLRATVTAVAYVNAAGEAIESGCEVWPPNESPVPPKNQVMTVALEMSAELPVMVGDKLADTDGTMGGIVAVLTDSDLPGWWPRTKAGELADVVAVANAATGAKAGEISRGAVGIVGHPVSFVLNSRGDEGPYSLITHAPFSGRHAGPFGTGAPARISMAHLENLFAAGADAIADELIFFKGAAPAARAAVARAIKTASDWPAISDFTETTEWLIIRAELLGMGFLATIADDGLFLEPATDADILRESFGGVKKPETVNYRTFRPERDGLFCESIFGPEAPADPHDDARWRRFGHLALAVPMVPWWAMHGRAPVLPTLLGASADDTRRAVLGEAVPIDGPDAELSFAPFGSEIGEFGPRAIREWLESPAARVRVERQLAGLGDDRESAARRQILSAFLAGRLTAKHVVWDALPVTPPGMRPLIRLESGNFATADINDLYRRAINRNNRLAKLMALNAPAIIIQNEIRMLQMALWQVQANEFLPTPTLGYQNRPLVSLAAMIARRVLETNRPLTVNFSGHARAIVAPKLAGGESQIPAAIFERLAMPGENRIPLVMFREGAKTARVRGTMASVSPDLTAKLSPADATALSLSSGEKVAFARVHVPGAVAKLAKLAGESGADFVAEPDAEMDDAALVNAGEPLFESLIAGAVAGRELPLSAADARVRFGVRAGMAGF